jgi:hypothetical protein
MSTTFLVVGIFGTAEPIIASLDEPPHVGMVLKTDTAWNGLAPGTKLRVTHIKARPTSETSERTIVRTHALRGSGLGSES